MKKGRGPSDDALHAAAKSYERAAVLPHCPSCKAPCCKLEQVVLELDWPRVERLYSIGSTKRAFDASLRDGSGPPHIRAAGGLYYAFRSPCPAYDEAGKGCRVYGTDTKPPSCDDFPVYADDGALTADLRCEAVVLDDLQRSVEAEVGVPMERVVEDDRFPFLVRLRAAARPRPDDRPAPPRRATAGDRRGGTTRSGRRR